MCDLDGKSEFKISTDPAGVSENHLLISLSYQFDGEERVELLKDYPDNFWMQNNPRYQKQPLEPIP